MEGETQPTEENYGLGRQIACGGMGSVIEAEDRKLGRTVALKAMPFQDRQLSDPDDQRL